MRTWKWILTILATVIVAAGLGYAVPKFIGSKSDVSFKAFFVEKPLKAGFALDSENVKIFDPPPNVKFALTTSQTGVNIIKTSEIDGVALDYELKRFSSRHSSTAWPLPFIWRGEDFAVYGWQSHGDASLNMHVNSRTLPRIFQGDFNLYDTPISGYLWRDDVTNAYIGSNLSLANALSDSNSTVSRVYCVTSGRESVAKQFDSINAGESRNDRECSHEPLGVGVRPRVKSLNSGYQPADFVWLAFFYVLIGCVTLLLIKIIIKPREIDKK